MMMMMMMLEGRGGGKYRIIEYEHILRFYLQEQSF
jgi:hypothetical protein